MSFACEVEQLDVPREELQAREFIKQFGVPDSEQDWSLATRVTAVVDPSVVAGAETVCVYDRMPGSKDCQLAARYSASTDRFTFDFPKAADRAYVQAFDSRGVAVVSGFFPISGDVLNVSRGRASRSASVDASRIKTVDISAYDEVTFVFSGDVKNKVKIYGMYDSGKGSDWVSWGEEDPAYKNPLLPFTGGVQNNYLSPDFSDMTRVTSIEALCGIVGKDGVFNEGLKDNKCNLEIYKDNLKPADGVVYTPEKDGAEISIEYIYGAGIFHNSFGYFYYKEGASEEEMLKAPMLMMMFDASPWRNTKRKYLDEADFSVFTTYKGAGVDFTGSWKGITNYAGMLPSNDIDRFEDEGKTGDYLSSTYNLVYYPIKEDGSYDFDNGTYKFPRDVRIGFFIICQGYPKMIAKGKQGQIPDSDFRLSLPALNKRLGNNFKAKHGGTYGDDNPAMSFVTYNWNGNIVMGVEDGSYDNDAIFSDHDMNDILFFVHGVTPPNTVDLGKKPKIQSWLIACEDLGGSYDFDFNDVVFGVSHFSTDDKSEDCLKIKALAAGGILPVKLLWTDNKMKTHDVGLEYDKTYVDWKAWFDEAGSRKIINAADSKAYNYNGGVVTIPLQDYPDYTITGSHFKGEENSYRTMGGFSIMVTDESNPSGSYEVKPIGYYEGSSLNTPQMILVKHNWLWPTEGTAIFDAYSGHNVVGSDSEKKAGFGEWAKNRLEIDWSDNVSDRSLVVGHNWAGEAQDETDQKQ